MTRTSSGSSASRPSRNSWSIEVRKAASVLPGAGRRGDERVSARADRAPAVELGLGRRQHAAGACEPRAHQRWITGWNSDGSMGCRLF